MKDGQASSLVESYYEDLNGEVLGLVEDDNSVVISFECDDWNDIPEYEERRKFKIRGHEVVESTLTAPYRWVYGLYSTSGMLVEDHHGSDWIDVYWKSRPHKPHEVIGRLYENHERLSDGMKDLREYLVASPTTLSASNGLLITGPSSYAISQAESVEDLLNVYTLRTHRKKNSVVGLGIDSNFMICQSIEIIEFV